MFELGPGLTNWIYHCKSLAASSFLNEYGQELVKVVEANLPRNIEQPHSFAKGKKGDPFNKDNPLSKIQLGN